MNAAPTALRPWQVDWTAPWLVPWRAEGERVAGLARTEGLIAALNAEPTPGLPRFVPHTELPPREPYESFIRRAGCVPTRDNLHDLFNGLAWHLFPALKWRLNELQAGVIARDGIAARRGPLRDALTLFDENAALWTPPAPLAEALRRRDWHALFVTHRGLWAEAGLTLFGHALIEKLVQPRASITAHLWVLDEWHADPAARGHLPLPVLGVPGWWPANQHPAFYGDASVFRPLATGPKKRHRREPMSPGRSPDPSAPKAAPESG